MYNCTNPGWPRSPGVPSAVATAFQRDRRRDAELTVAGHRVVRFAWRQVTHEPGRVSETLTRLLYARRRAPRSQASYLIAS
jgi:hypothetical protein